MLSIKRKLLDEAGEASFVSVAMFTILFAATTVSFTYVVTQNYRRTTNSTLQSTAKAAAESGIEDAKRMLIYCSGHPGDNLCSAMNRKLDDQACEAIINEANPGNFSITKGDGGNSVKVGNTSGINGQNAEYYQCLKIAKNTKDVEYTVDEGKSKIIPLRFTGTAPRSITLHWHNTNNNLDGQIGNLDPYDNLPQRTDWVNDKLPAILRVEIASYPASGTFSVSDLAYSDSAVTLRPVIEGSGTGSINMWSTYHPVAYDRPNAGFGGNSNRAPLTLANCSNVDNSYACSIKLGNPYYNEWAFSSDRIYYLRVSAIYRGTHFKISVGGNTEFDNVQPEVEVTGRSADSYARVKARLEPVYNDGNGSNKWYPEYAVSTGGQVCKDMNVYYDNGVNNCAN